MKNVMIYSTPTCSYCKLAKQYFTENGVKYVEYDVAADLTKRSEMIEKSGQMGVPVIDIEGTIVVGYNKDQLAKLLGL